MGSNITNMQQHEQEFAYVDLLITAHTNAAIAKVNAEALQTYWEVGAQRICAVANCTNKSTSNCADNVCTNYFFSAI